MEFIGVGFNEHDEGIIIKIDAESQIEASVKFGQWMIDAYGLNVDMYNVRVIPVDRLDKI